MATQRIYTAQIRDTDTHSFPDTPTSDGYETNKRKTLVKMVNKTDQPVDMQLFVTTAHDPQMEEAAPRESTTVPAGESDFLIESAPVSYLRADVTAATAPTSGDVKVAFQSTLD